MKKRKLNGIVLGLIFTVIIVIISLFKIPSYRTHEALKALGYSEDAISAINSKKLKSTILDNSYYSDFLNEEITKDTFDIKYLNIYLNRTSFSEEDKQLYEKLMTKKEYTEEDVQKLFVKLNLKEIQPLLLFDKVEKIDNYIDDVKKNSIDNIKGKYYKDYENATTISSQDALDVVVNKKRDLGKYVPSNLVELGSTYSVRGVELEQRAYEAFYEQMAPDMAKQTVAIYATRGYVSYEYQESLYNWYELPSDADTKGILKPGFNERQTGLVLSVVSSENDSEAKFKQTQSYVWLKLHAHEYGFIFRYPQGKEKFTRISDDNENILRYVGVELATKIHDSGLSLDEYYTYYID